MRFASGEPPRYHLLTRATPIGAATVRERSVRSKSARRAHTSGPPAACSFPQPLRGALTPPHALLALDTATGAAIGCATFEHRDGAIHSWQVRVVRPQRRRGIGAQLAAETLTWAMNHRATSVNAVIETCAAPDAEAFLIACGFACRSRLFTVEADMTPLCDLVCRPRDRSPGKRTNSANCAHRRSARSSRRAAGAPLCRARRRAGARHASRPRAADGIRSALCAIAGAAGRGRARRHDAGPSQRRPWHGGGAGARG